VFGGDSDANLAGPGMMSTVLKFSRCLINKLEMCCVHNQILKSSPNMTCMKSQECL